MDDTTQGLTILTILIALVGTVLITQFVRRRKDVFALRDMPAFRAIPLMIGEAIEANRPLHVSFGSAGIGSTGTLLAVANAETFYQAILRANIGSAHPIITVSDPTAIPLAQDTLRKAYKSRGLLDRHTGGHVRWYPAGGRSLAFAASLTSMMGDDKVAANILTGSFGPELSLIAESARRQHASMIAASDQLEGQAVALALSDEVLIGEEMFAASAYLGERASHIAGVITLDLLRWVLIAAIILLVLIAANEGEAAYHLAGGL